MLPLLTTTQFLGIEISDGFGYALPALVGVESLGIPSPGETALILASVLASQGHLDIWLVALIGVASAIVGDNIGYAIGRVGGRPLFTRAGPFRERRLKIVAFGDRFFAKHGAKAVFFGRWVALMRVSAAWMAGITHMPFGRFFLYNALGGLTWGVTVTFAAYYLGEAAGHVISRVGVGAAVVIGVVVVVVLVLAWQRERRDLEEIEPGA